MCANPVPRMLVVDHEQHILAAMRSYFSWRGFEVDVAESVERALELLEARAYALVITDLRFARSRGNEGLEIAAEARRRSPSTRTIVLTAYGTPEGEEEARRRGVDAFLYKPAPLAEVAQIAMGLLDQEGELAQLKAPTTKED